MTTRGGPRAIYHWVRRRGQLIEVVTMTYPDGQRDARVAPTLVIGQIRRQHFAVLSTVGRDGAPHSAGVTYGSTRPGGAFAIHVMTRRHLLKARNIQSGRRVIEGYRRAREHGEGRVCFVRIIPDPKVRTYIVGYRIWEVRRNMEAGSAKVILTPGL